MIIIMTKLMTTAIVTSVAVLDSGAEQNKMT